MALDKRVAALEKMRRTRPALVEHVEVGQAIADIYGTPYTPVLMTPEAAAQLDQRVVMIWGKA